MTDDSLPAFPSGSHETACIEPSFGLSQLDWFAGMALQGLLAAEAGGFSYGSPLEVARFAYDQAAAMIAEQKKRQKP